MSSDLQPALFESEDDGAILLPPEEIQKRYTGAQAEKIERVKTAVLMLLGSWPVETIARELHLSTRTVRALAAASAEKVAGYEKGLAQICLQTGARWLALARTRELDAPFKDLVIGAGIVLDKGQLLAATGQIEGEKETKEVQDHAQAAEALRRLMAEEPAPTDSGSTETPLNGNDLGQIPAVGAGPGVVEPGPADPSDPDQAGVDQAGGGGGQTPGSPSGSPMGGGLGGPSTKGLGG